MIAVASWAKEEVKVRMDIDWKVVGLKRSKARLHAPAIPGFQDGAKFDPRGEIPLVPGKGWLFFLEDR